MLTTSSQEWKLLMSKADLLSDISVVGITKGYEMWGKAFISSERIVENLTIVQSLQQNIQFHKCPRGTEYG